MWYQGSRGMTSRYVKFTHALRMREVKNNSKREIRTTATLSACKRLTDCANRTSLVPYGKTFDLIVIVTF